MDKIIVQIRRKQVILNDLYVEEGTTERTLELSHELDNLIIKYYEQNYAVHHKQGSSDH